MGRPKAHFSVWARRRQENEMKIAIVGGGPIGIEAALYGACAGFDVHLYERGRLAENVRQWGHVGLFTEWKRNRSPLAVRLLREAGAELPPEETTSSGDELADYVVRLAALPQLRGRLHPQTEVASITRERTLKSDYIGDARRANQPFRLLLKGAFGEKIVHADAVLDVTGVYATPNFIGDGGAACLGEMAHARRIDYHLPYVAGRDRARFANRHTLIAGSGHSAASTLRAICDLLPEHPQTRVTWIVRRDVPPHGFPYTLIPDDASPHRDALHRRANELTQDPNVDFKPRTVVEKVDFNGRNFQITLASLPGEHSQTTKNGAIEGQASPDAAHEYSLGGANNPTPQTEIVACDNVVAHTGFRPDRSLWSELQVHEHPATGGPFRLAQAILEQNKRAGVGLSTGYAEKNPDATTTGASTSDAATTDAPPGDDSRSDSNTAASTVTEIDANAARLNAANVEAPVGDRFRAVVGDPQLLAHPEPNFFIIGIKSYGRDAGFLMQNGFRQVRDVYKLISGDAALDCYEGALDEDKSDAPAT